MADAFRQVAYSRIRDRLTREPLAGLAMEVSGTAGVEQHLAPGVQWSHTTFPQVDWCTALALDDLGWYEAFALVFADQILEHVLDPLAVVDNMSRVLKPGGLAVVATPFLFPVHDADTGDYWRFTPAGLKRLLGEGGFIEVEADGWGSKEAVHYALEWNSPPGRSWNLEGQLGPARWQHLLEANDPDCPVVCWAFGRKPAKRPEG